VGYFVNGKSKTAESKWKQRKPEKGDMRKGTTKKLNKTRSIGFSFVSI